MSKHEIPLKKHGILPEMIDGDALFVTQKLQKAGHTAYLVGGCIRDLLLNEEPKDWDISTSAKPEEIKRVFGRGCLLIGRRFRLAHVRFGKKVIEVSTFRKGDIDVGKLVVNDNEYGDPKEDALRRDFTINGLFYDPSTGNIIDYVKGYPDVKKRYLEVIGNSEKRFTQDPVRMLRLLKFMARFDLTVDQKAITALRKRLPDILEASSPRVLEEILRMLESTHAANFFSIMHEYGMLGALMPGLEKTVFDGPDREKAMKLLSKMDEVQIERRELGKRSLARPVLLAALMFPQLHRRLLKRLKESEKPPHLEQIQREAGNLIIEMVGPFLRLSKRDFLFLSSVMKNQYRFKPLDGEKKRRIRLPREDGFAHSLKFFLIRSELESGLSETWKEWQEAYDKLKKSGKKLEAPKENRRPRRRRDKRRE